MPEDYVYIFYKRKFIKQGLVVPNTMEEENISDLMMMNEIDKAEKKLKQMHDQNGRR